MLEDKLIQRVVQFFSVFIIINFAILLWKWNQLPPELPQYYSLPRSSDLLGTPISLLLLPFLSLVFFIIHFTVAAYLYLEEKLASTIMIVSSCIVTLIFVTAYVKIVFLVT